MHKIVSASLALGLLSGCEAPLGETRSGSAEASGLVEVRPYPTSLDVCSVIGESEATQEYLDHTALLIGCPESEPETIADRVREGATRLETVGGWVLLSVPLE